MANIELQIVAEASKAVNAITRLEDSLKSLSTTLGGLNTGGLSAMADSVKQLTSAMGTVKGTSAKDFNKLSNGLRKIAEIDTSNFTTMSGNISALATALSGLGGANIDKNITNLVNAFTRLAQVDLTGIQGVDFGALGQKIVDLANALQSAPEINRNIIALINAIAKLANAGANTGIVASELENLGKELLKFMEQLRSAPAVSSEIATLVSAIAQLASAGAKAGTTADNLNRLGTQLNSLITTLSRAPQVSSATINLVQALAQLASAGGRASVGSSTLHTSLNRLPSSMNKVKRSTKGLVSAIGMFYAKCFLLIRAIKGLWGAVEKAMDFIEVYNYFSAAMGELANNATDDWSKLGYDSAEAYYDSFEERSLELTKKMTGYEVGENGQLTSTGIKNLGLDPTVLLNYQAQFAQVANSMGVASEDALLLSKSLTMLGADLASIKNEDFETVWKNMASGMVGMSRAVDKYGTNIRNAAMQEKLDALGINAKVAALSQADKAMLRTIIMVEDSKYAWGDLARTLEQPRNQIRMLQAAWSNMCRTMGALFTGLVAKIVPYINVLLMALTRLFQFIAKIFGISLPDISSQAGGGMEDLGDAIGGVGDAMEDANGDAKKLKGNLLAIDELNVINSKDDSGSGQSGLGGYGGALSDALKDLLSDYDDVWNKAYDNLRDKVNEWLDWLLDFFRRGDYYGLGKAIADWLTKALKSIDWDRIYQFAEKFGKGLAEFLNGLIQPELFYQIGRTMAGLLNTAFHFVGSFVETFDWKKAGLSLANLVNGFFDELQPAYIAKTISNALKGVLDMTIEFLKKTDWEKVGYSVMEFLSNIDWLGIMAKVWEVAVAALSAAMKVWKGAFDANPIATLIMTSIADWILIGKGMVVFNAISKVLSNAAATEVAAKGLFSGIATAFNSLGGLSGLLTMDLATVMGAGTLAEIGLTMGTAIIGGVAAAFVGYSIGSALYQAFIEDTDWDAFGYDYFNKSRIAEQEYIVSKEIENAEDIWNKSIYKVADNLDWSGLIKFEGNDTWATTVNAIDEALSGLSFEGIDLGNTEAVMNFLNSEYVNLDSNAYRYIQLLSEQYDGLDENTKALLDLEYGFEGVSSTMSETDWNTYTQGLINMRDAENDANQTAKDTKVRLEEQERALNATREAVNQYALEHGASLTQISEFNSVIGTTTNCLAVLRNGLEITTQTQARAIDATLESVSAYALANGASQEYADRIKGISKTQDVTGDSVSELSGDYSDLMTAFEQSSLTANDFSTYMETLSSVDIPKTTEGLSEFNEALTTMQETLPSLKETFELTFEPFNTLANETIPYTTEAFATFRSSISTQMPMVEQAFTNSINNIQSKLEEIKNWYKENIAIIFTEEYWTENLGAMETAFLETTKGICNGIIEIINLMIDKINEGMELEINSVTMGGEEVVSASTQKLFTFKHIEGFMNGGFPQKSNLFYANENGSSEFIGRIGGNPAVANNDQIVQAVSTGVYNAVMSAMSNNESNVNVYLEGDAQGIFRVVREQNRQFTKQTGRNAFA